MVATGVNADGYREVVGVSCSTSETHIGWLTFFNDLVARGLSGVASVTTDAGRVASGHHSTSTLFTRAGGQMN